MTNTKSFEAIKSIIVIMCFDYEFPDLEKDLMKPQKKNIETEKLEERPLTVTA